MPSRVSPRRNADPRHLRRPMPCRDDSACTDPAAPAGCPPVDEGTRWRRSTRTRPAARSTCDSASSVGRRGRASAGRHGSGARWHWRGRHHTGRAGSAAVARLRIASWLGTALRYAAGGGTRTVRSGLPAVEPDVTVMSVEVSGVQVGAIADGHGLAAVIEIGDPDAFYASRWRDRPAADRSRWSHRPPTNRVRRRRCSSSDALTSSACSSPYGWVVTGSPGPTRNCARHRPVRFVAWFDDSARRRDRPPALGGHGAGRDRVGG